MVSRQSVKFKRSTSVSGETAVPPPQSAITYGEIAINYAKGKETIYLKNTNDEIVQFLSDAQNARKFLTREALDDIITSLGLSEKYVVVEELPQTPDATTAKSIYLVGPNETGNYERWITQKDDETDEYSWKNVGTTDINLDLYTTVDEVSEFRTDIINELSVIDTVEPGFYVVDSGFNVGLKLDEDGLFTSTIQGGGSGAVLLDSIPEPKRIIRIDFEAYEQMPTIKDETNPILAHGKVNINFDGNVLTKYCTFEVQGASSQTYPKKNWSLDFYSDKNYSEEFEFRIANLAPHSTYVFKSDWIDATHCRNIVSNKIWEQIVMARDGYPKREFDFVYDPSESSTEARFDSGAIGHVDGFPAVLYINNEFYGIGNFNIGKKRVNYNLNKNNQNHIQIAAEAHCNFKTYSASQWEIRNPKTPDSAFTNTVSAWFNSNNLTGTTMRNEFEATHNLTNAIDYYIFIEFLYADDCVDKNVIVTTWDGVHYSFMPYDLDTTFGLYWDGSQLLANTGSVLTSDNNLAPNTVAFWTEFFTVFKPEICSRYQKLKELGILTVDNVYKLLHEHSRKYGLDLVEQEQEKWPAIPSNSTVYTGIPQIVDWVDGRLEWMDTYFTV